MPDNTGPAAQDHRVSLIPTFVAKPGSIQDLENALNDLQAASRRDPGCVVYDVLGDLADPARFFLYEQWEDDESLADHNRQSHVTDFLAVADPLLAEPMVVHRLRSIG